MFKSSRTSSGEVGTSPALSPKQATGGYLIPALVFAALTTVFIGLWSWDRRSEREALHARAEHVAEQAAMTLETCIDARLSVVELMSGLWSAGRLNTPEEFTGFALALQRSFDGLLAINWIDVEGVIRWVVPAEPNQAAVGRSVYSNPEAGAILRRALQTGGLRLTPPIELFQGGRGVAAYLPLTRHGAPDGFLNLVFRAESMIASCLNRGSADNFSYAVHDDGELLFADEDLAGRPVAAGVPFRDIDVGQRRWRLTLFPRPAAMGWFSAHVPEIVLAISVLVALGVAGLVRRALSSRAMLEARTSELQAIYQAYPDLQFRVGLDGTILGCQVDTASNLYLPPEQFLGRRMQDVLPGEIGERFEEAFRAVRERGGCISLEYSLELAVGSREFEARILPLKADELIVIARDITDRKHVEARLESNRFAIEHGSEPIYWVKENGRISYANQAACRSLGYSAAELEGLRVSDIDPDFPADGWPSHWAEMKRRGSMTFKAHHRTRDGRVFPVEVTTNHVEYKGEQYIWAYTRDLTESQRAEEDRRQLETQLRQSQKLEAVGQLAGGVAHEFNNLLTVILGCGEIALRDLDGAPDGAPDGARTAAMRLNLEQIASAGKRGAALTQQLLAFSRKEVDAPAVIAPARLITETQRMLRHLVREDVSIEVTQEPELGRIRAGSGHLEQIIINLVLNARDAMPEGGCVQIDCANVVLDDDHARLHSGARAGRHVKIAVRDNGEGMNPETLGRIFEPFYTTKPVGEGTGLGLATVYGYVTSAGGHLTVESEPGEGSTFTVYYPVVEGESDATDDPSPLPPAGHGEVILVCEDDATVRRLTRDALQAAGYHVLEAEDGARALELAASHGGGIDLLVTDVVMPGMNGPALAEAMLADRHSLRVLFVSGYPEDLVDMKVARTRGHGFLEKPFGPEVLLRRTHEMLVRPVECAS